MPVSSFVRPEMESRLILITQKARVIAFNLEPFPERGHEPASVQSIVIVLPSRLQVYDSSRFPHTFGGLSRESFVCRLVFARVSAAVAGICLQPSSRSAFNSAHVDLCKWGAARWEVHCRGRNWVRSSQNIDQTAASDGGWQRATICSFTGFNLCNRA